MKNKAINALIEMGMPADLKGFHYIADAMQLFANKEYQTEKITALYFKIAQMNNTTISKVERAIRHAFEVVITKGDLVQVKKYLTLQNTANGNLLHVFYLRLTQEG